MIETIFLLILPVALAFAAAYDLFSLTIPNRISLALIVGFAVVSVYLGLSLNAVLMHLAAGVAVLMIGYALFEFSMLGGGDAKLLAAGSLWMGAEHAPYFIAYTTFFGGALALAILAFRQIPTGDVLPPWAARLHVSGSGIPYGIAIAAAGLIEYPSTHWFAALAH